MADTDWSKYDKCPTCLAEAGSHCLSMKGSGPLARAHVGRQKAPSNAEEARAALMDVVHKAPSLTSEQAAELRGLLTIKKSKAVNAELAKHHIKVTRQKLGEHWTWRATCSCGMLDGHYWGDDVSPKKEFERHLVPGA